MSEHTEYRRLLSRSPAAICIHDGHHVQFVNRAAVRALGASSEREIVGCPIVDFIHPSSLAGVRARIAALREDGEASEPAEVTLLRTDGSPLTARTVVALRHTVDGPSYEVVFHDPGKNRLHAVLDLLHDGVVIIDRAGRFEFTNAAARRMLGSGGEDLVGVHHTNSAVDLPLFDARGQRISVESHPIRWIQRTGMSLGGDVVGIDRLDGQRVWITGHGCLIDPDDSENPSVLFSFTDITEHHDTRERLLHDATHDWLTGLPNRVHAFNEAARGLARSGADRLSAVLFIDLDGLKGVNDSHGHSTGDDVLRAAAHRMRSVTRPQDLVARIGGDEFVVLLMGPVAGADLDAVARRLQRALAEDIEVGTRTLRVGASIGITIVDDGDERSLAEVLRDADTAMYRAKAQGPARTAYSDRGQRADGE